MLYGLRLGPTGCRAARALRTVAAAAACVWLAVSGAHAGDREDATLAVERFQATLIDVMKEAGRLGYDGRYRKLDPAVRRSHDLPRISEIAAGRHWRAFDEAQRARLVDTFSRWTVGTYALRFDSYSGQVFRTESAEADARGDVLVRSVMLRPNDPPIHFDYVLRRRDDAWRIVNIIVDGVSDLAIRRAEFASMLSRDGFDALIAQLEAKIADYARP
ncbi:MAG: ABC transporter substrate-binding protein [Pseudomonadota bacterium]